MKLAIIVLLMTISSQVFGQDSIGYASLNSHSFSAVSTHFNIQIADSLGIVAYKEDGKDWVIYDCVRALEVMAMTNSRPRELPENGKEWVYKNYTWRQRHVVTKHKVNKWTQQ